ncbi:MAG: TIGR04100 family radical SAM protein [Lachnospiraceae bacterium]|nr:TIGR04100 family radical SAM protein [Lachnospiraceae bacterium]
MTIIYKVKNGLYVNLTNRCPCACTFCLRQNGSGIYGSDSLWLEHEPSIDEVKAALDAWDLSQYGEVVFCGYGEPTVRLPELLAVAEYIRSKSDIKIRINTNGLANLIWNRPTESDLAGLIDTVSISLNANNAEDYLKLTRSKFGIGSWQAMLDYARECTKYVPKVVMTVVDKVTTPEEQEAARQICDSLGVTLRVRAYEG